MKSINLVIKRSLLLLSLTLLVIALPSCKKARLNNLKNHLSVTWKVSQYYKNGHDETSDFHSSLSNYQIIFGRDGNFTESFKTVGIPVAVSGEWELIDDGDKLVLKDNSRTRNFEVDELKKDVLTLTLRGNDTEKFYMIPK